MVGLRAQAKVKWKHRDGWSVDQPLVAQAFSLLYRGVPVCRPCGNIIMVAALLSAGCVSEQRFRLREVSPGLFEGCKPTTDAQFEQLRARGVRTILSVQVFSWDITPERRMAREHGFTYINVPIWASPLPPPEDKVRQALEILSDPSLRPIYFHCLMGEDRTTMLLGLYRIYYEDWAPEDAWQEMIRDGFHVRWSLRGFETYFWSHTRTPEWAGHRVTVRAK